VASVKDVASVAEGARPLLRYLGRHGNEAAIAAVQAKADTFAQLLRAIIEDIEVAGITSNRGIAQELQRREILTARGTVEGWTDTTVARLRARLAGRS
jgi:hypothetical protein